MCRYVKFFCVLLVVSMIFILLGCGGLSDDELKSAVEEYTTALQQLCDSYGLDDAKIEVEHDLPEDKIGDTLCCIGISRVSSGNFLSYLEKRHLHL